jgi:AcrR family transcriptional regulator
MSNFTEKAIKRSFLKLLNERPLNKITVKDIVEDCSINRNSFYYHFRDLPALVEEVICDEFDRIMEAAPTLTSIEDCLSLTVKFALKNKKAIMHICASPTKELYERYLWRACEYAVTLYIDRCIGDREISSFDRDLIIRFHKCECFGLISDWLNSGMTEDAQQQISRLCTLRQNFPEQMIQKAEEL